MPYKAEVRSILESLSASRGVSGAISVPDIELGGQPYAFAGPIGFEVTLTNTGAGIVAAGRAHALVRTCCVRCLCDMEIHSDADVEAFYVRPGRETELPQEQEFEFVADDSTLDLEPAVTQSVVVDLPFAPVHSADCKGLCPSCGADLNSGACGCPPRMARSAFE
jgi:uncharacterized protein